MLHNFCENLIHLRRAINIYYFIRKLTSGQVERLEPGNRHTVEAKMKPSVKLAHHSPSLHRLFDRNDGVVFAYIIERL